MSLSKTNHHFSPKVSQNRPHMFVTSDYARWKKAVKKTKIATYFLTSF